MDPVRTCDACGAARAERRCTGCDVGVYYCDTACQQSAWARHRTACRGKFKTAQQVVEILAAGSAEPPALWKSGTRVMLHSLVRRPELNSRAFIVTGYDAERGRVTGHMDSDANANGAGLCIQTKNIAAVTYRHAGTQGEPRYVAGDIMTDAGREEVRTILTGQNVVCPTPITVSLPKSDFLLAPMPLVGEPSMFPGDGTEFLDQLKNNLGVKQRYVDLTSRVLPSTPVSPTYDGLMSLHAQVSRAIELTKTEPPTVVLLRCTASNVAAFREMLRVQILMHQSMMCGWVCVHELLIEPYCGVLLYGADAHYIQPQLAEGSDSVVHQVRRMADVAVQSNYTTNNNNNNNCSTTTTTTTVRAYRACFAGKRCPTRWRRRGRRTRSCRVTAGCAKRTRGVR